LFIGLGVLGLVLAAKAHGRELRLEREAFGIRSVVFCGVNPPQVESLWSAERLRFWVLAPLVILAVAAAARWVFEESLGMTMWHAFSVGPVITFLVLGVASIIRAGATSRGQLIASVGWWLASAVAGMGSLR